MQLGCLHKSVAFLPMQFTRICMYNNHNEVKGEKSMCFVGVSISAWDNLIAHINVPRAHAKSGTGWYIVCSC